MMEGISKAGLRAVRLLPRLPELAQRARPARNNRSAIFAASRPLALRLSAQAVVRSAVGAAPRFYVGGGPPKDTAPGDSSKVQPLPNKYNPDNPGEVKPNDTVHSRGAPDPKAKALSLLDALPTTSLVSKSGIVAAGVGTTILLVAKEIYIFNQDTIQLFAVVTAFGILIKYLTGPVQQFILERNHRIWGVLRDARNHHRSIIRSRIDEVDKMSDIVDVTKNMFEMSKDMAKLEAQAFELKQKLALHSEIKAVLDSWVRHETAVRQREQTEIAQTVVQRVRKSLTDPSVQEQILQQAVADVERLVAAK